MQTRRDRVEDRELDEGKRRGGKRRRPESDRGIAPGFEDEAVVVCVADAEIQRQSPRNHPAVLNEGADVDHVLSWIDGKITDLKLIRNVTPELELVILGGAAIV